jgi:hypothetical protein|tara:strand:+ start:3998 stop:4183 length:186 start_codon:yes stop_codon:yes gene_type:complete
MLEILVHYLLIGIGMTFVIEVSIYNTEEIESGEWNNIDRIFNITLWPITIFMIIKRLFGGK